MGGCRPHAGGARQLPMAPSGKGGLCNPHKMKMQAQCLKSIKNSKTMTAEH